MSDSRITKKDLADKLADEFGLTRAQAQKYVNYLVDTMIDLLVEGNSVDIVKLGKFTITQQQAHQKYSPYARQVIDIPETRKLKFKPSKGLVEQIAAKN